MALFVLYSWGVCGVSRVVASGRRVFFLFFFIFFSNFPPARGFFAGCCGLGRAGGRAARWARAGLGAGLRAADNI